jgi:hypothetical protein
VGSSSRKWFVHQKDPQFNRKRSRNRHALLLAAS